MKKRIVLEFIFTLFLLINLSIIAYMYKMIILVPFMLLMVMSLTKIKYVFYKEFDYNDRGEFVVSRENFILFHLYIFKGESGTYIDDGYFFYKVRESKNIKVDYKRKGKIVHIILNNYSIKRLVSLFHFGLLVLTIVICVFMVRRNLDEETFQTFFLFGFIFFNLIILLKNMVTVNRFIMDCTVRFELRISPTVDIPVIINWFNFNGCGITCEYATGGKNTIIISKNYWYLCFMENEVERICNYENKLV